MENHVINFILNEYYNSSFHNNWNHKGNNFNALMNGHIKHSFTINASIKYIIKR